MVITRADALKLTLAHYNENKAKYPKDITKKRDDIIEMILDNYSVEEAFTLTAQA